MKLLIFDDYEAISRFGAELVAQRINAFAQQKGAVDGTDSRHALFSLGLPTGATPLGMYRRLVEMHKAGKVSFARVATFNMDEYVGLSPEHPESYHSFMFTNFFRHIDIDPSNVHIPNGNATDLAAECANYERSIAAVGGIDLFVSGIGTDGHMAFNEPGSSLRSRTRVQSLDAETIAANARFLTAIRVVIAGQVYEWNSNVIPFQIWGGDANFQNLIRRGIRMWEEVTCLRFRENVQATDAIRYVLEKGDSCFTEYIGRNGGFQDIIIGSECAEEYVVAHETGHALGYWHTHQRPDREKYISINWRNVLEEATASFMPFRSMLQMLPPAPPSQTWSSVPPLPLVLSILLLLPTLIRPMLPHINSSNSFTNFPLLDGLEPMGSEKNVLEEATASFMPFRSMLQAFGIKQVSTRRAPYDYGSLMHYHAVAHARQVSDFTIVPKELKYVTTMGTERMAFLDAKVINDIYCPNACSGLGELGRPLRCQSGGYPDPNNCNVCRCPEGLGGIECDRLQPSNCGAELQATDQWQTLRSPHGKDIQCFWRISANEGSRVRFRLSDGEFPCSYGCQSYVEIKHKLDIRLTGFRSCCYRPKEDTLSDGNQIFVIYRPNGRTARFSLRFIRQL
uniref:Metalloendopeptidase n=1 Tax=Globodera pallida TaxID=36090 RepID=A0A183C7J7_GLOPA